MPQQKNMLVYAETNTDRPKITADDMAGAHTRQMEKR